MAYVVNKGYADEVRVDADQVQLNNGFFWFYKANDLEFVHAADKAKTVRRVDEK